MGRFPAHAFDQHKDGRIAERKRTAAAEWEVSHTSAGVRPMCMGLERAHTGPSCNRAQPTRRHAAY
ncbi:hypothetical protein GCM10027320_34100 [Massilia solisilvae]